MPLLGLGLAGMLGACAGPPPVAVAVAVAPAVRPPVAPAPVRTVAAEPSLTGLASWYRSERRLHRTYSGEALDDHSFTAASWMLPIGSMVRVGRADGSRSVVVRVNDRMPRNHRLIDLSEIAARDLGLMDCGVAKVTVTPIVVASAP